MKIELEQVSPHEIEKRSFEIITEELNGRTFPEDQELVVKRCITQVRILIGGKSGNSRPDYSSLCSRSEQQCGDGWNERQR